VFSRIFHYWQVGHRVMFCSVSGQLKDVNETYRKCWHMVEIDRAVILGRILMMN